MEKKETKKYTDEERKKLALEYLKNRYGEEFEGVSFSLEELMKGYDEFYVYPKSKTKDDTFLVTGNYHKDDGVYVISDGYLGIILQPEFKKIIEDMVQDFYEEFWITVKTIGGAKYSKKYTLDEIMKM